MGFKDLFFIPFVYLLRTALLLYTQVPKLAQPYDYFAKDYTFFFDSFVFMAILAQCAVLHCIYLLHMIIRFQIGIVNLILGAIWFWPLFYYRILTDPRGRSIRDMLCNPQNAPKRKRSRFKAPRLKFFNASRCMYSYPQSQGAYAHVDEKVGRPTIDAVVSDVKQRLLYYDDPLLLSVPYEYIAKAKIEPPDGILYDVIAFLALLCVFMTSILRGYIWLLYRLFYKKISRHFNQLVHWLRGRVRGGTPNGTTEGAGTRHVCLTLSVLSKERFAFLAEHVADAHLASWDTDGIYFCIDNCATCIICNERSMFIGDLKPSNSEVLTSNGQNVPATEGTIRIVLDDDDGVSHTYDIPGALYDPESSFNLLGIPYLSKFFGDAKEMGTNVTSGCYKSYLVWDHEKHGRHFSHGVDCLPSLQVNVGQSYFTSFCTRVRHFYDDNVRFSFRAKARVRFDPLLPPTKPTKKRKYCDTDFEQGMELIYKDGFGSNRPVVYEGAVVDGLTH
jgi:hypothetical protein